MPLATVDGGERRGRRTREEGRSDRQRTGRGTYSWVHERLTRSDGEEEPGPGMMVIISGPPWAPRLDLAGLGERRVDEEASASLEAESMTRYRREKGALRKRPARRVVVRLGPTFLTGVRFRLASFQALEFVRPPTPSKAATPTARRSTHIPTGHEGTSRDGVKDISKTRSRLTAPSPETVARQCVQHVRQ